MQKRFRSTLLQRQVQRLNGKDNFAQNNNHGHDKLTTTPSISSLNPLNHSPQPTHTTPHSTILSHNPITSSKRCIRTRNNNNNYTKTIITTTNYRRISFNPGSGFMRPADAQKAQLQAEANVQAQAQQAQDDLRRFAFKKPQQFNLSQNPNTTQGGGKSATQGGSASYQHQTLMGKNIPVGGQNATTTQTIKQQFFNDPTIPRWRKDLVRVQDFFLDHTRPITYESDTTLLKIGKKLVRMAFFPPRRFFKLGKWLLLKFQTRGKLLLPVTLTAVSIIVGFIYLIFRILDRTNMAISRELFIRSCVIDLAARLDAYGILPTTETSTILQTFQIFVPEEEEKLTDDMLEPATDKKWYNEYATKDGQTLNRAAMHLPGAPKNYKGQEMMKAFLMQAMSLPIESARTLEALYDPKSRIDEVSEGIHAVFLEKMADVEPSTVNEACPPHIRAIAGRIVEEWFKRTRLQMIEEKKRKLQLELKAENIDDLTPQGRQRMKDKLDEFNMGITFDLSKREKRKLFWKGILTGVMLETGLVGLENETTFLRLAREYAIKGCVLRQIPDKVKISDNEIGSMGLQGFDTSVEQALITANPSGEFTFSSEEELKKIRDSLTQQPYSPDHGQIDKRFLHFLFGADFCQEYGISPDSLPYVHQIAPLVLFDLATWTHPQTIFDLTFENEPRKLQGSKYTSTPAEFEKIEMFNFMIDEMIKKDTAYGYIDGKYRATSISRDELIVLPLLQPQDSLRNPHKYGLEHIDTQLTLLQHRIPQCYQDTYGAYGRQIFLFDMIILRNLIEMARLKRSLGELSTTDGNLRSGARIRDMKIPVSSNYYANYGRLLQGDLLDVIKREENLTSTYRLRGMNFRKEFDQRVKSDQGQLNRDSLKLQSPESLLLKQVENDFRNARNIFSRPVNNNPDIHDDNDDGVGSTKSKYVPSVIQSIEADPRTVSVDAELFRELRIKPHSLHDLQRDEVYTADNPVELSSEIAITKNEQRRQRAQKWIDNGSI